MPDKDEEGEAITKLLTFPCTNKGFEKLVNIISSLKLEKDKTVIGIEAKLSGIPKKRKKIHLIKYEGWGNRRPGKGDSMNNALNYRV